MDKKQNDPIQPAAEHTPLDEAAARVLNESGGQVHHVEGEGEQMSQSAHTTLGGAQPVVHPEQMQPQGSASPSAPQQQTLLDVLVDMLTLKWFKKNMRNKYGEDINRVREIRQAERDQHLQKPVQTYTPPPPATPPQPMQPPVPPVQTGSTPPSTGTQGAQQAVPQTSQGSASPAPSPQAPVPGAPSQTSPPSPGTSQVNVAGSTKV